MSIFSKEILSGSTDGMAILIDVSGGNGTTIHSCSGNASGVDEVWLYAQNNHTADVALTIQFGDVSAYNDIIKTVVSKNGLTCIVPGLILKNSKIVRARADIPNVISLLGYVNRIVV
jgi:hypothetical protein